MSTIKEFAEQCVKRDLASGTLYTDAQLAAWSILDADFAAEYRKLRDEIPEFLKNK